MIARGAPPHFGPRPRGLRPVAVERDELSPPAAAPRRGRRRRAPRPARHAIRRSGVWRATASDLARDQADRADDEQGAEGERRSAPSDSALANKPSIRLVVHRPKASETRPPRPAQAIAAQAEAPAAERGPTSAPPRPRVPPRRSASRGFGRDRIVLRLDDRGRRERRGAVVDGDARSSRRKARGRGGRSVMPDGPRSGIAGRGRAGSAGRRLRRAKRPAAGSGRSASRCPPRQREPSPAKIAAGSAGSSPGKHRGLGGAVERVAADRLARFRRADDRR